MREDYYGENVVLDTLNGLKGILYLNFCLRFKSSCSLVSAFT